MYDRLIRAIARLRGRKDLHSRLLLWALTAPEAKTDILEDSVNEALQVCPDCGSPCFYLLRYDFGSCQETGYRDAGERRKCAVCGFEEELCRTIVRK
jgi:hypothetical protein